MVTYFVSKDDILKKSYIFLDKKGAAVVLPSLF